MYLYHNSHRRSRFEFYDEVIIEHDDLCDQAPNEHFVKFRDIRGLCSYEIPEGADLLAMFRSTWGRSFRVDKIGSF